MSHSTFVKDDQGREWVFIHNGDWSGEVTIRRIEKHGESERDEKVVEDYTLPGAIIRKACASAVVRDAIAILEQWDGTDEEATVAIDALTGRRRATRQGK